MSDSDATPEMAEDSGALEASRREKLRKLVEDDMPPANVGLWATWKEMMMIYRKSQEDPNYYFVPDIPNDPHAEFATDTELSREASGTVA